MKINKSVLSKTIAALCLSASLGLPGIAGAVVVNVITNDQTPSPRQEATDNLVGTLNERFKNLLPAISFAKGTNTISGNTEWNAVRNGIFAGPPAILNTFLGISSFSSGITPAPAVNANSALALRLIISPPPFVDLTVNEFSNFLYNGGGNTLIQQVVDDMACIWDGNYGNDVCANANVMVIPYFIEPNSYSGWYPAVIKSGETFDSGPYDAGVPFSPTALQLRYNRLNSDIFNVAFPNSNPGGGVPGATPIGGLCGTADQPKSFSAITFAGVCEEQRDVLFLGEQNPVACGAPNLYADPWFQKQGEQGSLLVNKTWFAGLTTAQQNALLSAAKDTALAALKRAQDPLITAQCTKELRDNGSIIHNVLPKPIVNKLSAATPSVITQMRTGVPTFFDTRTGTVVNTPGDAVNFGNLYDAYVNFANTN